jgi:hypothetical protein
MSLKVKIVEILDKCECGCGSTYDDCVHSFGYISEGDYRPPAYKFIFMTDQIKIRSENVPFDTLIYQMGTSISRMLICKYCDMEIGGVKFIKNEDKGTITIKININCVVTLPISMCKDAFTKISELIAKMKLTL